MGFIIDTVSQNVSYLYSYARQCIDLSEILLKNEIQEMQEKKLNTRPKSGTKSVIILSLH